MSWNAFVGLLFFTFVGEAATESNIGPHSGLFDLISKESCIRQVEKALNARIAEDLGFLAWLKGSFRGPSTLADCFRVLPESSAGKNPDGSEPSNRRLWAHLEKELNRNESSIDFSRFCRDLEDAQRRDLSRDKAFSKFQELIWPETPREIDFIRRNGLTQGEFTAIKLYTSTWYKKLNPPLNRGIKLSEQDQLFADVLNAGLDKITPAETSVVWRASELPTSVLEMHQVGNIVTYSAFTSATRNPELPWGGNKFEIYSVSGKYIAPISQSPAEQEVLFRSGARFKVMSKTPHLIAKDRFKFVLAEVDSLGEIIAPLPPAVRNSSGN